MQVLFALPAWLAGTAVAPPTPVPWHSRQSDRPSSEWLIFEGVADADGEGLAEGVGELLGFGLAVWVGVGVVGLGLAAGVGLGVVGLGLTVWLGLGLGVVGVGVGEGAEPLHAAANTIMPMIAVITAICNSFLI